MDAPIGEIEITAAKAGQYAIVTSRIGLPIVVLVLARRDSWCVWGIFKGRTVRLDKRMPGAWIGPGDAVDLENGRAGVVRHGEWVVLEGEEAARALEAAGPEAP